MSSAVTRWLRCARRLLCGGTGDSLTAHQREADAHRRAIDIIRVYYGASWFVLAWQMAAWTAWPSKPIAIELLWPVAWVDIAGPRVGVTLFMACTFAGLLWATLSPARRAGRVLFFVGLLMYVAYANSFGKINHSYHAWLAVAFWFCFLPSSGWSQSASRVDRRWLLFTVWAAIATPLLFFSISGIWKVAFGLQQMINGEVHAFAPEALAHHIARRTLQSPTQAPAADLIINNAWLGYPLFLATIYLEVFSFLAAFRPKLHRLWGASLILFHIGSQLGIGVIFKLNILLFGILLVASPFAPRDIHWRETLGDLPGIALLRRIIHTFLRQSSQ